MFSVIRAHQLKALNSNCRRTCQRNKMMQNALSVSVCLSLCLSVCLFVEKSFSFQFKFDTGTNFVFCVCSQKARSFDIMVLKCMYIKLDKTNFRHVQPSSQLIYMSHLTLYLRAKK
jgi:hypothetical protein